MVGIFPSALMHETGKSPGPCWSMNQNAINWLHTVCPIICYYWTAIGRACCIFFQPFFYLKIVILKTTAMPHFLVPVDVYTLVKSKCSSDQNWALDVFQSFYKF